MPALTERSLLKPAKQLQVHVAASKVPLPLQSAGGCTGRVQAPALLVSDPAGSTPCTAVEFPPSCKRVLLVLLLAVVVLLLLLIPLSNMLPCLRAVTAANLLKCAGMQCSKERVDRPLSSPWQGRLKNACDGGNGLK